MFVVRGYGKVWGQLSREGATGADQRQGYWVRGSLSTQLARGGLVTLHRGHEGPLLARTDNFSLELFEDHHGLGFEAHVFPQETPAIWDSIGDIRLGLGVSTENVAMQAYPVMRNGKEVLEIREAQIVHLALLTEPNYASCCCWLANSPRRYDSDKAFRINNARDEWDIGYRAYVAAKVSAPKPTALNSTVGPVLLGMACEFTPQAWRAYNHAKEIERRRRR